MCYIQPRPRQSQQLPGRILRQAAYRRPPRRRLPELLCLPPDLHAAVKQHLPAWSSDKRSTRTRLLEVILSVMARPRFTFGLAAQWAVSSQPRPQLAWLQVPGWQAGNLVVEHEAQQQSLADHRFCLMARTAVHLTRWVDMQPELAAEAPRPRPRWV